MLVVKRYGSMESKTAAAMIAEETIRNGYSQGWSGDTKDMEVVADLLRPFNICYVDDWNGRWEHRHPEPKTSNN